MSAIRRTFRRITAWITRKDPPSGPGSGGPGTRSFEEARATSEIHRAQGSVGPQF
jgi:hypothetical protein